jgi:RND family efflux transporter MFP subunit
VTRGWLRRLGGALPAAIVLACGSAPGTRESAEPSALVATEAVARARVTESLETFGTVAFDTQRTRAVILVRAGEVQAVQVVEGAPVHAGDPLVTLGPLPERSPQVQSAVIDLRFAREELARVRRVAELHLATNQDVQKAERDVAAARATLRALGAADREVAETLRAPADGIVSQVQVTQGSVVQAGQTAVVLAPADAVAVRTGFEVEDVPRLSEGLDVFLTAVYAPPGQPEARARLARLHRVADPATQLVEALIAVPEPPAWMVAGERVRVRVVLAAADEAVAVSRDALVSGDGGSGVFVVRDGRARWQPVKIGLRGETRVQVLEGLSPGDTVVTTGRTALSDGMTVRTASSKSAS